MREIIRPFVEHAFSEVFRLEEPEDMNYFYNKKNISHPIYFGFISRHFTDFNYYRGFIEGMRRTGLDNDTLIENCRIHVDETFNGVESMMMEEVLRFVLNKQKKNPSRFFSSRDIENLSILLEALEKKSDNHLLLSS